MEVEYTRGTSDRYLPYVVCEERDDIGPVWLEPAQLERWSLRLDGLAECVGRCLGALGSTERVIPERLWYLGGPTVNRSRTDVFLARGTTWPDAHTVFPRAGRLHECDQPLVLVLSEVPTESASFGQGAKLASLARLLLLHGGELRLDRQEIERIVGKLRTKRTQDVVPFPTPPGTRWQQVVMVLVNERTMKITAGTATEHKTYEDMGFTNRGKLGSPPDKLWVVLTGLAAYGGSITWEDGPMPDLTKKHVSDLRKRLRSYFGIRDDPFERYDPQHGYKAKFAISNDRTRHR